MVCSCWRVFGVALCMSVALAAQVRVSLQSSSKPGPLEQQVLQLGNEVQRGAATRALIAVGRPAVPLLLRAVQRDDATSLPALRVLAELGGTARAAYPALAQLGNGDSPLAHAAAFAAAQIGERDSIVCTAWQEGKILEVDADGKQLRSVQASAPWCVQVLPHDRLLVCCYTDGAVREIDWTGKEYSSTTVREPMQAQRLLDGGLLFVEHGRSRIVQQDRAGNPVREWSRKARQVLRLPDDDLLVLQPTGKDDRLLQIAADDRVVSRFGLRNGALAVGMHANGRLRVLYAQAATELDAEGKEHELGIGGGYAYCGLRDGGYLLGNDGHLVRGDASGAVLWKAEARLVSSIVARLDVPEPR